MRSMLDHNIQYIVNRTNTIQDLKKRIPEDEDRESVAHNTAKHMLAKLLEKYYRSKGKDGFCIIKYPIIETNIGGVPDHDYFISKDNDSIEEEFALLSDYPSHYEGIDRVDIFDQTKQIYEEGYGCNYTNKNMPSLSAYEFNNIPVKYFCDLALVLNESVKGVFEIEYRNPIPHHKKEFLTEHFEHVYEIPANFILSLDVNYPEIPQFLKVCEDNYKLKKDSL